MKLLGAYIIQTPPDDTNDVLKKVLKSDYPLAPPPWGGDQIKNMHLFKFNSREDLFYKYRTILKKFTPPPGPPLTPATLDLGPKSKICSHNFVCHVKCFPK